MPTVVDIPDVGEVEFPDTMNDSQITDVIKNRIIPRAHPASLRAAFPGRQGTPAPEGVDTATEFPSPAPQPAAAPGPTAFQLSQPPSPVAQLAGEVETQRARQQAQFRAAYERGEEPTQIPGPYQFPRPSPDRFGGGLADVGIGLGEWALNNPQEFLLSIYPPTEAAMIANYSPDIAKQIAGEYAKAIKGDNAAAGRAIGLTFMVGFPLAAKAFKAVHLKALKEAAGWRAIDKAAIDSLRVWDSPGLVQEGIPYASKIPASTAFHGDVRPRQETTQTLSFQGGSEGVQPQAEGGLQEQPSQLPPQPGTQTAPGQVPDTGILRPAVGDAPTVSVPLMITRAMEEQLRQRGLTQAEIDRLTPAQAHEILSKPPETKPAPPSTEQALPAGSPAVAAVSKPSETPPGISDTTTEAGKGQPGADTGQPLTEFAKALNDQKQKKSGVETKPVNELHLGQTFHLQGEEFKVVYVDPDTNAVHLHSEKYGTQVLPDGETIPIDEGTLKAARPVDETFFPDDEEEAPAPTKPAGKRPKAAMPERAHDVIDELEGEGVRIRPHTHMREGEEGYYGNFYQAAAKSFGNQKNQGGLFYRKRQWDLFDPQGVSPDDAVKFLRDKGFLGEDATVDDLWDAIEKASESRLSHYRGESPEMQQAKFSNALDDQSRKRTGVERVNAANLEKNDEFYFQGQHFRVSHVHPENGEVEISDGKKFGIQILHPSEDLHIDEGTLEKAPKEEEAPTFMGPGAAGHGEFTPVGGSPTAMKYRAIDEERVKRGLEPLLKPESVTDQEVLDKATAAIDRDPSLPDQLVDQILKKPRSLEDWENHVLLIRKIELREQYYRSAREAAQAYDDGREEDLAEANQRTAEWSDKLAELELASRLSGSARGRALRALQVMLNEDFTLASLEMRKRAANGGKPLGETAEEVARERARLQKLVDEHQAKSAELEEHLKQRTEELRQAQLAKALAQEEAEAAKRKAAEAIPPHVQRIADKVSDYLGNRAQSALDRLRKRGIYTLDAEVMADLVDLGASTIAKGLFDFGRWSASMLSELGAELGEKVRPYLDDIWKRSQEFANKTVDDIIAGEPGAAKRPKPPTKPLKPSIPEKPGEKQGEFESINDQVKRVVKGEDPLEDFEKAKAAIKKNYDSDEIYSITPQVRKLARYFIETGVHGRELVVDAVHDVLKQLIPDITRTDTVDALSGYGNFRMPSQDEVSVELRDYQAQLQLVRKLQDMAAGQAPERSGVGRDPKTDEQRRLTKQVEEAKRKGGYTVTNPLTQLRTALDSVLARLKNQIADLNHEIKTRTRILKKKSPTIADRLANPELTKDWPEDQKRELEEIRELTKTRDELKAHHDTIFGKRDLTDEQLVKLAIRAAERSDAEYQRRIAAHELVTKRKPSRTPETPELKAARAKRDASKEQLQELRDLDEHFQAEKEAARLGKQREALEKDIEEKQRKLREKDLSAPKDRASRPAHPELEPLMQQRDELNRKIAEARKAARVRKTPEQIALQGFKTRLINKMADRLDRMARGDYGPKLKKPPVLFTLDKEAIRLRAEAKEIEDRFEEETLRDRMANRTKWEKLKDFLSFWRRESVLSSPVAVFKLMSAAVHGLILEPAKEVVGAGLHAIAPRAGAKTFYEQRSSIKIEAKAFAEAFRHLVDDVGKTLRTGQSDLDRLYGGHSKVPGELKNWFGRLHASLKTTLKRQAWTRAVQKITEEYMRNGIDVRDPLIELRIGTLAYKEAERALFQESNIVIDGYKRFLSRFEALEPKAKSLRGAQLAGSIAAHTLLPIVRIPTNIVARTLQGMFGFPVGLGKLFHAYATGIENLKPEQADLIFRQMKAGSIGGAMVMLGYFYRDQFGGFYEPGEKRKDDELKPGEARLPEALGGGTIPRWMMHRPEYLLLQFGATAGRVADSLYKGEPRGLSEGLKAAAIGLIDEVPFVREMFEINKIRNPYTRSKYLNEMGAELLEPQLLRKVAEWIDGGTKRNPQTFWESLEMGIPFLRSDVEERKQR